jgi:hypothetical protein
MKFPSSILLLGCSLLPLVQGTRASLSFELVGAYYAYKAEMAAFGENNPNHSQEFAPGCKTQRPGKNICSFDEFIRHVMPNVVITQPTDQGPRFNPQSGWAGPDNENPDVRMAGTNFQKQASFPKDDWKINFRDVDINLIHSEVGISFARCDELPPDSSINANLPSSPQVVKHAGNKVPGLLDYTAAYIDTLRDCRTTVNPPPGRDPNFQTDPANNPDLAKCQQAFSDAHTLRSYDSDKHLTSSLQGFEWLTLHNNQVQKFIINLARGSPINLPNGQGNLRPIDWQATSRAMGLPPIVERRAWRNFHQDIVRGTLDARNSANYPRQIGLGWLTRPDPNDPQNRSYLKVIKSHSNAKLALQNMITHLASTC